MVGLSPSDIYPGYIDENQERRIEYDLRSKPILSEIEENFRKSAQKIKGRKENLRSYKNN